MKSTIVGLAMALISIVPAWADRAYSVTSPDGQLSVSVTVGKQVKYSVSRAGQRLISPSTIALRLKDGRTLGEGSKLKGAKRLKHKGNIKALFYKKANVADDYNELLLTFGDGFAIQWRAYDEGVAYRFELKQPRAVQVKSEVAQFAFAQDWEALTPYVKDKGDFTQQFSNSFENTNTHGRLSALSKDKLIFLPILVKAGDGVKISVTESDLDGYPGMYLNDEHGNTTLRGVFAPMPDKVEQGGYNNLELLVKSAKDYIAEVKPGQRLPWRIISVSAHDKDLLANDMVYRLAEPSKVAATDWIKPGKVAWDWWNDWGLYHVPFKAGINTQTYKYYIDFAARYGIEYVLLDEGWAVNKQADLFQIVPEIDLQEIIRHADKQGVGIILWAGCYAFDRDMERVCKTYSEMGVKGFKIDFLNRDDAQMVDFASRAAAMCAKYHLLVDFHGTYKPTGLNRTYPNVLNFEGVAGLEQNKWSTIETYDQVQYDTEIPFTRMLAGQMDYTQGAMLNGTKATYHRSNSQPMSQGTRCHQLGEYIVFFSPLNMLCDSPTHYLAEAECTDFIASVPVVWDETLPLDSRVGQYVTVARRSGNTWYVGGITNWQPRDLTLDLSAIKAGGRSAEIFIDGVNAEKYAQDYAKEEVTIPADGQLKVHLAPGGGFAMKIK